MSAPSTGESFTETVENSAVLRDRLPRFLALDHPILPADISVSAESGNAKVGWRLRGSSILGSTRLTRESGAALYIQAASAALFFASRGFPLEVSDFEDARVEQWNGAAHLWLSRIPRSALRAPARSGAPGPTLAELVPLCFGKTSRRSRGSIADRAVEGLLDSIEDRLHSEGRPDFWILETFRRFPVLSRPEMASVRRRSIGFKPAGFDERERRWRAASVSAGLLLSGARPRIFCPGESDLVGGDALRASLGRPGAEEGLSGLERELSRLAEQDTHWLCVDPSRWDEPSSSLLFHLAERRGIQRIDFDARPARFKPDELRDALWVPSPDLASSVALYEALGDVVAHNPGSLRRRVARFVGSEEFGAFLRSGAVPDSLREAEPEAASRALSSLSRAERRSVGAFLVHPEGVVPEAIGRRNGLKAFPVAAAKLAAAGWFFEDSSGAGYRACDSSARADLVAAFQEEELKSFCDEWLPEVEDPAARAHLALKAGRLAIAREAAAELLASEADCGRRRDRDFLIRELVAGLGPQAPAQAVLHEAARLSESGQEDAAREILEGRDCDPSLSAALRARIRAALARSREVVGDASGAGDLWRKLAEDSESAVDLRRRAFVSLSRLALARSDAVSALAWLDQASALPEGRVASEIEIALARADIHSRAGEFESERRIYERERPRLRECGDEDLEFRFLLREGFFRSDARDHEGAALRFAEALAAAGNDAEKRGVALMDLGVSTQLSGDGARAEGCFREALVQFEICGNVSRRRAALGNLANYCIVHGRLEEAEAWVEQLTKISEKFDDPVGRLLALSGRARVDLRSGRFASAAKARAAALSLCEELDDRFERAELEIEESDGRLFSGDFPGAVRFAQTAASRPADKSAMKETAEARLRDLRNWMSAASAADALPEGEIEDGFRDDPLEAAQRIARARAFFGEALERSHADWCARARRVLCARGRPVFAETVFGRETAGQDVEGLRRLRDDIEARRVSLRAVAGGEAVVWKSGEFGPAAWRRPLSWGGEPVVFLEGASGDPDSTAFVFETVFSRAEISMPGILGETGLEVFRAAGIVTEDSSMKLLGARLSRIAPQAVTVFVSGESGTGKEKIARAVHDLSPRRHQPFVAVNVAAFPDHLLEDELFGHSRGAFTGADRDRPGLFEAADRGTLFLDEVGDLSAALQVKLLRAIQEREIKRLGENRFRSIDVRLISATARCLEKEVEAGRFREDLYYRIKVATLELPPLRDRGGDVVLLARHFLKQYADEYNKAPLSLSREAAHAIRVFSWPGNVRQLQNAMMEAAALSEPNATIGLDGLPAFLTPAEAGSARPYRERVDEFRKKIVEESLAKAGGNRTHAARSLGLTRQALLYLIRELSIRG
jgi:transcriptional regulator with AAA-type ATPase domain/tetratricopeptide (TPR) repeat protein